MSRPAMRHATVRDEATGRVVLDLELACLCAAPAVARWTRSDRAKFWTHLASEEQDRTSGASSSGSKPSLPAHQRVVADLLDAARQLDPRVRISTSILAKKTLLSQLRYIRLK